jgi:hypothetical protein
VESRAGSTPFGFADADADADDARAMLRGW